MCLFKFANEREINFFTNFRKRSQVRAGKLFT